MNCKVLLKDEDVGVTEMRIQLATSGRNPGRNFAWRETIFDISTARRALVYISRVAADASMAYATTQECRVGLELAHESATRAALSERRDAALRRLNAAIDECNAAGIDLLDIPSGTVRLTVQISGQQTALVWRLGDSIEHAWEDQLQRVAKAQAALDAIC